MVDKGARNLTLLPLSGEMDNPTGDVIEKLKKKSL